VLLKNLACVRSSSTSSSSSRGGQAGWCKACKLERVLLQLHHQGTFSSISRRCQRSKQLPAAAAVGPEHQSKLLLLLLSVLVSSAAAS
jgi:hypothetical protein